MRKHLTRWLFTGSYRSERLTPANHERMLLKACRICAELLPSARCLKLGFEFRDPAQRHPIAQALDALNGRRMSIMTALK